MKERLQKILASAGIDSRRNCEQLILDGFVKVNNQVVDVLPAFADPDKDTITVNNKKIKFEEKVYYLLNKPKNILCTNFDPQGRKIAIDLIDCKQRIFCVGRLDKDTTGAIILTNDSELTNRLTHPRYELPKTYHVSVKGKLQGEDIEKIKKGIWLSEGKTQRAALKILKRNNVESLVEIVISEGKNRQVRRMLEKLGHKVKSLKRTKIGSINLKGISIGKYRKLSPREVEYLKRTTK